MMERSREQARELKYKIDRRLRVNLWGRPKSPINKRGRSRLRGQGRQKPWTTARS
jgi:small subunit ribosomal protein S4